MAAAIRVPDAAEADLVGRAADTEAFRSAARIAIAGAEPLSQNGFKVLLARNSVERALTRAAGRG
jgi:xanthine dehydrogenase YagS FAD-binding subunit